MDISKDGCATTLLKLLGELDRTLCEDERLLNEIVGSLQEERFYLSTFDTPQLLLSMGRRTELIGRLEVICKPREELCRRIWKKINSEFEMPLEIPSFLRALGKNLGADWDYLNERAQRLEALLEVIAEIHEVNQRLIRTSLQWDENMRSLVEQTPVKRYKISGRPLYLCPRLQRGS